VADGSRYPTRRCTCDPTLVHSGAETLLALRRRPPPSPTSSSAAAACKPAAILGRVYLWHPRGGKVRKPAGPLLSHVRIQAIVLPRRARDKHRRESTPKRRPFCAGERAEIFRAGRRGSAGRPNWSAILGAMRGGARTSRVTGKTGCTKSAAPKGSTSGAERPAPTAAGSEAYCNVMIMLSSIMVPVALMTIGFWSALRVVITL
jgi:hypothetical protein